MVPHPISIIIRISRTNSTAAALRTIENLTADEDISNTASPSLSCVSLTTVNHRLSHQYVGTEELRNAVVAEATRAMRTRLCRRQRTECDRLRGIIRPFFRLISLSLPNQTHVVDQTEKRLFHIG